MFNREGYMKNLKEMTKEEIEYLWDALDQLTIIHYGMSKKIKALELKVKKLK